MKPQNTARVNFRLTTGSTDLYLLHAPYGGKEGRLGACKALVEAVEAGKVRSIGVSNYGVHHLEELETYIKDVDSKEGQGKGGVLSVNQVELHPWLPRPDIVSWCGKRGVALEVSSGAECFSLGVMLTCDRLTAPSCVRQRWMTQNWYLLQKSMARSHRKYCCDGVCKR